MDLAIALAAASDVPALFDRALVRRRRARAAVDEPDSQFLITRMAEDLCDRLAGIERVFAPGAVQGCRGRLFTDVLEREPRARRKIETLFRCDVAPALAGAGGVVADDALIPFGPARLSLFLSLGTLHAVDDLPGALAQIRASLKPDGLFLASFFGGETLGELRAALGEAEIECDGGLSPRIAPFVEVQAAASLLQRAGFALPVVDRDIVTVTYETPFGLFADLRAMGETNALSARKRAPLRRATLQRALEIYAARFAEPGGRVRATFDILTLTGWAPHESQQVPLKPGSARTRLADALRDGS